MSRDRGKAWLQDAPAHAARQRGYRFYDGKVGAFMNGNLDNLLKAIAHSPDRAWLKQCRDHNAKLGRRNEATEQRLRYLDLLAALKMRPGAHTLEERILEPVQVYRALLKRKSGLAVERRPGSFSDVADCTTKKMGEVDLHPT